MVEKMRVHILAKELNVPSKTIVAKCHAEGIDTIKNHMSTLSAGLHETIREWFSEGSHDVAIETSARVDLKKVRIKQKTKATAAKEASDADAEKSDELPAEGAVTATMEAPVESVPEVEQLPEPANEATAVAAGVMLDPPPPAAIVPPTLADEPTAPQADEKSAPADIATPPKTVEIAAEAPDAGTQTVEVPTDTPPAEETSEEAPPPKPVTPMGPQHVPAPAKLQGPRVVRYEAPDYDTYRSRRPPPARTGDSSGRVADRSPKAPGTAVPGKARPPGELRPPATTPATTPDKKRGRVNPRRAAGRLAESGERMAEWRDRDLAERKERLAGATGRRIVRRRTQQSSGSFRGAAEPITTATVNEPVRMKEFCSETGLSFIQLFKVLKSEHGVMANINMTLSTDIAQLLALHFGIDLSVVPARTMLDDIRDEFAARERKNLQLRPPVVTMLGHVDHGKTSLLDAIRKTQVAPGEDGGITQHIGAHHVNLGHGAVTFLDTPGHAAFSAMRARGSQITDVVVLVIAADDGIMPQTVEAINHAKAAEVAVVVALNKIDLGDQNKLKIYGQLAEHDLTPAGDWGGEIDVIPTSATTGEGIDDLVEHLAALSSVLELKADPTVPATGTVVEAETKTGVGSVARTLIQDGTLRVGDFVACGNAAGKVRVLVDDRGNRIEEAGPSIPVEVWGLDEVPSAGDSLFQVESLQRAKDIATETKHSRVQGGRLESRKVTSLQEMLSQRTADEIPELNIIMKADVDGSVAALRQSLMAFPSDEVKLTIRHAGVGAVTDGDVLLASACHGLIVAFRVDTPAGARRVAESHGVDVRSYRVIYDVFDDVKKALEGLLAPAESVEVRGTANVREVFHLGKKAGVVAGSIVSEGTIDRKNLVKVIRDGVVVREGATVASLRRFKDDAKEVKSGLECGIRLDGFDDIHVGDTIQAYEIIKTARTL